MIGRTTRTLGGLAAMTAIALSMGLGGCASQQKKPAAKPVAQKPAEQPAARPAPAPARSGNTAYYPTGRPTDSVLSVERQSPAEVAVGQPFDYTLIVTNLSSTALEGVAVTESLPNDFTFRSSNPQASPSGGNLVFPIGRLNAGEQRRIVINGVASKAGTIASCSTAVYTLSVCQTINVVSPALAVAKTLPAEVLLCDTIPMKITVTNSGTGQARNVKISDPLPAGLTTADGKTSVEIDAGTLAAGQARDFTVALKAAKTGQYTNTARASAEGGLQAQSSNVSVTVRQPVLTIKAECGGTALIGRNVGCRFIITNTGDAISANTVVSAAIPSNTAFVSADNNGVANAGRVTWNLGNLPPRESRTVTLTTRSTGAGEIVCEATAVGACATQVADRCVTGVRGVPDIGTLLTDREGVILVGEAHPFEFEFANQGQVPLTNVRMVLQMPEQYEFVGTDWQPAPRVNGKNVEFALGTLAPGERKKLIFRAKSNAEGEFRVTTVTTAAEIKNEARNDEITTWVPR